MSGNCVTDRCRLSYVIVFWYPLNTVPSKFSMSSCIHMSKEVSYEKSLQSFLRLWERILSKQPFYEIKGNERIRSTARNEEKRKGWERHVTTNVSRWLTFHTCTNFWYQGKNRINVTPLIFNMYTSLLHPPNKTDLSHAIQAMFTSMGQVSSPRIRFSLEIC